MRRIDLRAVALLTRCGRLADLVEAFEGLAIGRILLALKTKNTLGFVFADTASLAGVANVIATQQKTPNGITAPMPT